MRAAVLVCLVAACGGDPMPDALVIDPTVIDVLVLSGGAPVPAGRSVMVISSDGQVQNFATDDTGHAKATLGPQATQATLYADSMGSEGKYTLQGAKLGDRVCLGCAYTTTTDDCAALPAVTHLAKSGQGWSWGVSGAQPYLGMIISWPGGRIVSPPGATNASTNGSASITVELIARDDVADYDALRSLSPTTWARTPFCASTAHAP